MFDVTLLILLGLAALGFISHNTTVAVSILVLIIVRVTPLSTFFPWICNFAFFSGLIGAQFWAERVQPKSPELDAKLLVSC